MPPKKVNKAAAELKKKNNEAAEAIVLNLKRNAIIDVESMNTETLPKRAKKTESNANALKKTDPKETNDSLKESKSRQSREKISSHTSGKFERILSNPIQKSKEIGVSGGATETKSSAKVQRTVRNFTRKSKQTGVSDQAAMTATYEKVDSTLSNSTRKSKETGVSGRDAETKSFAKVQRTVSNSNKKQKETGVSGQAAITATTEKVNYTPGKSTQMLDEAELEGRAAKTQSFGEVGRVSSQKSKVTGASRRAAKNVASTKLFCYEIDCNRVLDTINVTDLQKHFKDNLKVNGEKNNWADNIVIVCEGGKVLINSKVFLPKRSLRFMCKKFLKKFKMIQVISNAKKSYQFRFVGTP